MGQTRLCFEECDAKAGPDACKQICMSDARGKYMEVQDLTEQMVQINKQELSD